MTSRVLASLVGCSGKSRSCTIAAPRASGMKSVADDMRTILGAAARLQDAPRPTPFGLCRAAFARARAQRLDQPQHVFRLAGLEEIVIEADCGADHTVGAARPHARDCDEQRRERAVALAQLAR